MVMTVEKLAIHADTTLLKRSVQAIHSMQAEQRDRVKDVYEGGLKTWECSIDLVHYLHKTPLLDAASIHRILELGCGSGLPGIYCQHKFTQATVDFQDFNASVLALVTMPNVALNECQASHLEPTLPVSLSDLLAHTTAESTLLKSRFYAGSWSSLMVK